MSEYRFESEVQVRYSDLDTNGHVNYSVYATYFEWARYHYFERVLGQSLIDMDTVTARLEVDYLEEVATGKPLTVAARIPELGNSSIPMEYEVRREDEVVATGKTIQVVVDDETGSSRPIPDEWRAEITEYENL